MSEPLSYIERRNAKLDSMYTRQDMYDLIVILSELRMYAGKRLYFWRKAKVEQLLRMSDMWAYEVNSSTDLTNYINSIQMYLEIRVRIVDVPRLDSNTDFKYFDFNDPNK